MNLAEIIDRAEQIAVGVRGDAFQSALIDSEMTAETVFPHVLRYAVRKLASNGSNPSDLQQSVTVSMSAGVGTIPDNVLKEYLERAVFNEAFIAHLPYADYLRYRFNPQLSYYAYYNNQLFYKRKGVESFTGNLTFQTIALPVMPNNINDDIPLSDKLGENSIALLASVMLGEIPLKEII